MLLSFDYCYCQISKLPKDTNLHLNRLGLEKKLHSCILLVNQRQQKAKTETCNVFNQLEKSYFGFFWVFYFIINFEREHNWGRGAKGEKTLRNIMFSQYRTHHRTRSHVPRIMTWSEIKISIFNQLSHPGTSEKVLIIFSQTNVK